MYVKSRKFLKLVTIFIGISLTNGQAVDKESLLPTDCGQSVIDDKIVGGGPAPIGAYPWMAAIGFSGPSGFQFGCAGAVINSKYVLTAAHCLDSVELGRRRFTLSAIHLGDWDLSKDKDCQIIKNRFFQREKCNPPHIVAGYEELISHPLYNKRGKSSDDIALIKLNITIDFNSAAHEIRPVCLPPKDFDSETFAGMELPVAAGWGLTEHGNSSNILLNVNVPFANEKLCRERYKKKFVGNQLCVGGVDGFDTCGGDSGGPLVISSKGGPPFVQIGIVSFGPHPCGLHNFPGVYADVVKYRDWILENIQP